ncbi:hypothetical protein DFH28DRAFT_1130266 [Melampsora americana]|nr:hypothetical protein DFH28DRAFT_1130266 [Melampsora americana]
MSINPSQSDSQHISSITTSSPSILTPNPSSKLGKSHSNSQLQPMNDQFPQIITNTTITTKTATCCTLISSILSPCISPNSYQSPKSDLIPTDNIHHLQNHHNHNSYSPLSHLTTTPWHFNPSADNLSHSLNVHQPSHFDFLGNDPSQNFLPYQFQISSQPSPPPIPPNPHLVLHHQSQKTEQDVNHLKRSHSKSKLDSLLSSKPSKFIRIQTTNTKPPQDPKVPFSIKTQSNLLRNPIHNPIQQSGFFNELEITTSPESHLSEVQSNHQLDSLIPTSPIQSTSRSLIQNQPKSGQWKRKMTEKRREQNRTHQRAYRERRDTALKQKDDEIAGLRNEINDLKIRTGNTNNQDQSVTSLQPKSNQPIPTQNLMNTSTLNPSSNPRFLPLQQPSIYPNPSSSNHLTLPQISNRHQQIPSRVGGLSLPQISDRHQQIPLRVGGGNPSILNHQNPNRRQSSIPSSSSQADSNHLHQSRLPSPPPNPKPTDLSD